MFLKLPFLFSLFLEMKVHFFNSEEELRCLIKTWMNSLCHSLFILVAFLKSMGLTSETYTLRDKQLRRTQQTAAEKSAALKCKTRKLDFIYNFHEPKVKIKAQPSVSH